MECLLATGICGNGIPVQPLRVKNSHMLGLRFFLEQNHRDEDNHFIPKVNAKPNSSLRQFMHFFYTKFLP